MNTVTLPISEIFSSIQGEGQFTGVPSIFVRTSGCNLRCWFCDTPYTSWEPESKQIEVAEILERIAKDPARHVVITGGEPMLFPEAVAQLIAGCEVLGKPVTIETNGTRFNPGVLPALFSVSPKLTSSTPDLNRHQAKDDLDALTRARDLHHRNIQVPDLKLFRTTAERVQFKFVVCSTDDVVQVQAFQDLHQLEAREIWLMPEGCTAADILARQQWVAEACIRHGFNLSTRLHTLIWGKRRGV